jgi:hypothetical protein
MWTLNFYLVKVNFGVLHFVLPGPFIKQMLFPDMERIQFFWPRGGWVAVGESQAIKFELFVLTLQT